MSAEAVRTALEEEIAEWISLAERLEGKNQADSAIAARRKASDLRGKLRMLDLEALVQVEKDPIKRLRMREKHAAEAGSHVAAGNFAKQADKLEAAKKAEDEAKRLKKAAAKSEDELVTALVAIAPSLQPHNRARLREALGS